MTSLNSKNLEFCTLCTVLTSSKLPPNQMTTSEAAQDAIEGIGGRLPRWRLLAVERGRNAVSEMRESWRTSERKDGGRRWTTRFLGEEEGWRGD